MAEMDSPDQADREDTRTESMTEAAARPQEGMSPQREVPEELRGLQRAPRRVDIRREGGSYTIHFGGRNLASFCEEFSEITGYRMPPNTRQQVYITVEPIGLVRDWEETPEFTRALAQQQEDQAQGPLPDLSEESLERLLVDIPDRPRTLSEILERQINRQYPPSRPEPRPDYGGALLRSMQHPQRGGALARSMEEPSEDWRRGMYERLHQEIGQCSEMLRLLERL